MEKIPYYPIRHYNSQEFEADPIRRDYERDALA